MCVELDQLKRSQIIKRICFGLFIQRNIQLMFNERPKSNDAAYLYIYKLFSLIKH